MKKGDLKQMLTDSLVLNFIASSNGVTLAEIAESVDRVYLTVKKSCERLEKWNCISMGAVKYHGKTKTSMKKGYFYESDFPEEVKQQFPSWIN